MSNFNYHNKPNINYNYNYNNNQNQGNWNRPQQFNNFNGNYQYQQQIPPLINPANNFQQQFYMNPIPNNNNIIHHQVQQLYSNINRVQQLFHKGNQPRITNYFQSPNPQNNQQHPPNFYKVPERPHKNRRNFKKQKKSDPNSPGASNQNLAQNRSRDSSTSSKSRDTSEDRNRKLATINKGYADEASALFQEAWKVTVEKLKTCKEGSEVQLIVENLQHSPEDWKAIQEAVTKDLCENLKSLKINKAVTFGSAITGLNFLGSDIDFYISLVDPPKNDSDTRSLLNKSAKIIRMPRKFHVFCRILHARVPIIKVIHLEKKIMCDINYTSGFGFLNSKFIYNVMEYDPRIKEVTLLVKLWSKVLKVNERYRLSSYCLIMMIFFYMQNLEKPMLGSIKNSQKEIVPILLPKKHGWNFNVTNQFDKSKDNTMTSRELLVGFFEYWNSVDYENNVVSLYTGTLIPKKDFETYSHEDLEECRKIIESEKLNPMKIVDKCLTIQDGFELNLNIAFKNRPNNDDFFKLLKLTANTLESLKDAKFNELILKFLTEIKTPISVEIKKKSQAMKKHMLTVFMNEADLKMARDTLVKEDSSKVYTTLEVQRFCAENVMKNTIKFLQDLYLVDVKVITEESSENLIKLDCELTLRFDTVSTRKKLNFSSQEKIDAEIELSKEKLKKSKEPNFELEAALQMKCTSPFKSVEYLFVDRNDNKKKSALPTFSSYFSMNLHSALRSYAKRAYDLLEKTV